MEGGGRARGRGRGRNGNNGEGSRPGGGGGAWGTNGGGAGDGGGGGAAAAMGGLSLDDQGQKGMGRGVTRGGRREMTDAQLRARYDLVETRARTEGGAYVSKQGEGGEPITLVANYFPLVKRAQFRFLQYRVDFSVDIDGTLIKKAVVRRLPSGSLPSYLFDGTIMYTAEELYPHKEKDCKVYTSTYQNGDQTVPCEITVKLVGEVHPTDFHYLQVLNTIKAKIMSGLNMTQLGRDYFDTSNPIEIKQHNLQVYAGYKSAIRQHENGILLNIEVTHKVCRTDTVLDQMKTLQRGGENEIRRALIGCIVITKYNNKTYRVDDVDFSQTASSTFQRKDGSAMQYYQYYEQRYGEYIGRITDRKQPLLVSTPKERDKRRGDMSNVMLLPEVCHMTGITDEMRANYKVMDALAQHTRVVPTQRARSLIRFRESVNRSQECQAVMSDWDMRLGDSLVSLQARILRPVDIVLGDPQRPFKYNTTNADWSPAFRVDQRTGRGMGMNVGVDIKNWVFIYPHNMYNQVESMERELRFVAGGLGIALDTPAWVELQPQETNAAGYINKLRSLGPLQAKFNFVVVAINNTKGEHYSTLKKYMYCQDPVPNQVLTFEKVLRNMQKHRTFATKILLQMSTKLGGVPWKVQIPTSDLCVVGYDTYHDTANKKMSFGALVMSVNKDLTRFYSCLSRHHNQEEMSNEMSILFSNGLRQYAQKNGGKLPGKIVFYRDGVGDGQLDHVKVNELAGLDTVLRDTSASMGQNKPLLTVIVVSKRITTRFFTTAGRSGDYTNPPSGTVVDDVVTLPERFDFFLVSQSVRQGTVNPTSYNIIHNDNKWPAKIFQSLTYRLTHLYYNWPGTVRVPAPCQYAHKLAFLAGESLHQMPNHNLQDLLYYL